MQCYLKPSSFCIVYFNENCFYLNTNNTAYYDLFKEKITDS